MRNKERKIVQMIERASMVNPWYDMLRMRLK